MIGINIYFLIYGKICFATAPEQRIISTELVDISPRLFPLNYESFGALLNGNSRLWLPSTILNLVLNENESHYNTSTYASSVLRVFVYMSRPTWLVS